MKKQLIVGLILLLTSSQASSGEGRQITVLIAYFSRAGHTVAMAHAVAEGAASVAGTRVICRTVDRIALADLHEADALIVGSPVYNAGMASEVKRFIDGWPLKELKDKVGAAFCTAGSTTTGAEFTLDGIIHSMMIFQLVIVGGETWRSAFGAAGIDGQDRVPGTPLLDAAAVKYARELGARVARVAGWMCAGRRALVQEGPDPRHSRRGH